MNKKSWFDLIGVEIEDEKFIKFVDNLQICMNDAEIKKVGDSFLYNFYKIGLSMNFINNKLDSIDFFGIDSKFNQIDESLLPLDIKLSTTGKNLIELFGEPLEKGGGSIDIWLRWKNFQIDLNDKNWNYASNATRKSITIF